MNDIDAGTVFMNRCVPASLLRPQAAERISLIVCGVFWVCRCDYLDPALPWTGFKESGRGVSLSRYGYDAVTKAKSLHIRAL